MLREVDLELWPRAINPLILSRSITTIQKDIAEYESENNVVLPQRGTVNDLGRRTSHKQSSLENRFLIEKLRRTLH